MTQGERIRRAREALGYSQTELAAKLGISKQLVYKYEKDIITNIPLDRIEQIADICQVRPGYLTGWSNSATEKELVIEIFDSLDEEKKKMVLKYMQFLKKEQ